MSSAALCVLSSNGFGDLGGLLELPGPVRALLLAIPLCAPSGVLAYAWGGRRALGDRASRPQ